MPTYTANEPSRHDTTLIVGDTWSLVLVLEDDAGTAFDLTGVTGAASIRTEPAGTVIALPTVTITDASAGEVTVTLASAATADLAPGAYRYAVRLTWPSAVHTVVEGLVVARRSLV